MSWMLLRKYLKLGLLVYIVFSLFWGLNYYRQGIEKQIGLELKPYSVDDLFALTTVLQQRMNSLAEKVDSVQRLQYDKNRLVYEKGATTYNQLQVQYPYLGYESTNVEKIANTKRDPAENYTQCFRNKGINA